jgi:3-hydroxyacyl-[acyl-carrier-protein] dehydratase
MHTEVFDIAAEHPSFPGHFPGHPILPGVLVLERVMRVAARVTPGQASDWSVANVKFSSPVSPRDVITVQLAPGARDGYSFTVLLGGSANAELTDPATVVCTGQLRPRV